MPRGRKKVFPKTTIERRKGAGLKNISIGRARGHGQIQGAGLGAKASRPAIPAGPVDLRLDAWPFLTDGGAWTAAEVEACLLAWCNERGYLRSDADLPCFIRLVNAACALHHFSRRKHEIDPEDAEATAFAYEQMYRWASRCDLALKSMAGYGAARDGGPVTDPTDAYLAQFKTDR